MQLTRHYQIAMIAALLFSFGVHAQASAVKCVHGEDDKDIIYTQSICPKGYIPQDNLWLWRDGLESDNPIEEDPTADSTAESKRNSSPMFAVKDEDDRVNLTSGEWELVRKCDRVEYWDGYDYHRYSSSHRWNRRGYHNIRYRDHCYHTYERRSNSKYRLKLP